MIKKHPVLIVIHPIWKKCFQHLDWLKWPILQYQVLPAAAGKRDVILPPVQPMKVAEEIDKMRESQILS